MFIQFQNSSRPILFFYKILLYLFSIFIYYNQIFIYTMFVNIVMNKTIIQTTDELKNFFKTESIVYQAKVGYFVHLNVNGIVVKEANQFLNKLGLTISMIRATPNQLNKISLFLEFV